MNRYDTALYIFRRDLRLHDNTALNSALSSSKQVLPGFIFDPAQIQPHPYQSKPGLRFMLQSIADLQQQLHAVGTNLAIFHASPEQVLRQIVAEHKIQAVYVNRDYTPFSRLRDEALLRTCIELGVALHIEADYLLTSPEQTLKTDQTPYKVFTAFYGQARQLPVSLPQAMVKGQFLTIITDFHFDQLGIALADATAKVFLGGRAEALIALDQIENCQDYQNTRDFPALNATSRLSVHLKFGTCSVREVYYAILNAWAVNIRCYGNFTGGIFLPILLTISPQCLGALLTKSTQMSLGIMIARFFKYGQLVKPVSRLSMPGCGN